MALFYPGQSSYQWLRSDAHKGASKETARGDACTSCHDDPTEEATQGAKILGGKHPLEPHAGVLKGKNGHIDMTVQAAYDDNKTISSWKDGVQTVVFIRPLGLANDDDKMLKVGGVYSVGFAIHDDNMTGRGHHVSYNKTLGIGAKADIQAVKLN